MAVTSGISYLRGRRRDLLCGLVGAQRAERCSLSDAIPPGGNAEGKADGQRGAALPEAAVGGRWDSKGQSTGSQSCSELH